MIVRQAVRALLVCPADQSLLLARLFVPDSGQHIWLAPGGGVEPGENEADALAREVWEETGHTLGPVQGPVWRRSHRFVFRGEHFEQHEKYYVAEVERFEPTGANNPAAHEAQLMDEYRWWTVPQIAASEQIFVPLSLADHLQSLLQRGISGDVVDVGV